MADPRLPEYRASDADREGIVEILREASVAGRLSHQEFTERMEAAYAAKTLAELTPLTRDLPATGTSAQPAPMPLSPVVRRKRRWVVHVLGGGDHRDLATDGDSFVWVAFMGGGNLDLRDANLPPRSRVTVTMTAVMGGGGVIVPENARVRFGGFAFMGGRENRADDRALPPDAPVVDVRMFAFMGGGTVRSRPPRSRH